MEKWIEIERKDVKVGDIISHNKADVFEAVEIENGRIITSPGTSYGMVNQITGATTIFKKVIIDTANVTWTVEPSEPKPLIPNEPGHCLHCGAKAYVGLWEVGCSAKCKDSQ